MANKKVDFQYVSLSSLEKSSESAVWVLNNSNPRGFINFDTNDGMGNSTAIKVPISWMPIDLTTQATKNSILTNPQFRRLVSGDMLRLIDPDQARALAESPAGRNELKRLFELDSVGNSDSVDMPKELRRENASGVSGFILNLVNRTDITDEDSMLSALLGQESSLTTEDFKYLAENSTMPNVKSWAVDHLN